MFIDEECKEMLSGKRGRLVKGAMEFLIRLGEAYGAEDMVDIDFGFVYTTMDFWGTKNKDEAENTMGFLSQSAFEEAVELGVKVKAPAIGGLGAVDYENCAMMQISEESLARIRYQNELDAALGIMYMPTCDPYLILGTDVATLGCHMVSVESSAIPYYNSVLGAHVNREGIAGFFAVLTGKYPRFGYHIDENRKPRHLALVRAKMRNYIDYGILGLIAGEVVGPEVCAFSMDENPRPYDFVHLGSGMSSGGPVTMYHVIGVTPEARVPDASFNPCLLKIHEITDRDIQRVYDKHSGCGEPVDYVVLGCPFYNAFELQRAAEMLKGRKVKPGVSLWIHADPLARAMARVSGFEKDITEAGGYIVCGTCPQLSAGKPGPIYTFTHPEYSVGVMATDSIKQAHYGGQILRAEKTLLGDMERCIQAAVTGIWR